MIPLTLRKLKAQIPLAAKQILLFASKKQLKQIRQKYPELNNELDMFEGADPSGTLKYISWQANQLLKNESVDEIINLISKFHKNQQRLDKKDIFQYNSVEELRETLNSLGETRKERKDKEKDEAYTESAVIYDDGRFLVVRPETEGASCYFGRNTKWCVSATESKNYFNTYSKENTLLYFIIDREAEPDNPMGKVALAFTGDGVEIYDALDQGIGIDEVRMHLDTKQSILDLIKEHKEEFPTTPQFEKAQVGEVIRKRLWEPDAKPEDFIEYLNEHLELAWDSQVQDFLGTHRYVFGNEAWLKNIFPHLKADAQIAIIDSLYSPIDITQVKDYLHPRTLYMLGTRSQSPQVVLEAILNRSDINPDDFAIPIRRLIRNHMYGRIEGLSDSDLKQAIYRLNEATLLEFLGSKAIQGWVAQAISEWPDSKIIEIPQAGLFAKSLLGSSARKLEMAALLKDSISAKDDLIGFLVDDESVSPDVFAKVYELLAESDKASIDPVIERFRPELTQRK